MHDIDYMRTAGDPSAQNYADLKAINNSDFSLQGIATKIGLSTRMRFGFEFNTPLPDTTPAFTQHLGNQALNFVKTDPEYKKLFAKYDVEPSQYD